MTNKTIYAVAHHDYDDDWVDSLWSTREKAQARLNELFEANTQIHFQFDIDEYTLDKVDD